MIASNASEALHKESGVDVEDICVDVFYWFDKSTKMKGIQKTFCDFCYSSFCEVIRYVSGYAWSNLFIEFYCFTDLFKATLDLSMSINPGSLVCFNFLMTLCQRFFIHTAHCSVNTQPYS